MQYEVREKVNGGHKFIKFQAWCEITRVVKEGGRAASKSCAAPAMNCAIR